MYVSFNWSVKYGLIVSFLLLVAWILMGWGLNFVYLSFEYLFDVMCLWNKSANKGLSLSCRLFIFVGYSSDLFGYAVVISSIWSAFLAWTYLPEFNFVILTQFWACAWQRKSHDFYQIVGLRILNQMDWNNIVSETFMD